MNFPALAAILAATLSAQLSIPPPLLNNSGVEAMIKQGVPAAVIVQTIMNARDVEFLVNGYEFGRLTEAGAANMAAEQILDAMHQRTLRPPQQQRSGYPQTAPQVQQQTPQPIRASLISEGAPVPQPEPIDAAPSYPEPTPPPFRRRKGMERSGYSWETARCVHRK